MKASVVLLLVIGLAFYSTTQVNSNPVRATRALHDDLEDFLSLVPQQEIIALVLEYVENDEEIKFVIEYFQSAEFRELVQVIESIPEVKHFVAYLYESGLEVYDVLNHLHELIGLPPVYRSDLLKEKSYNRITGGISGLIYDVKNLLPMEDIKDMYYYKLENSVEFKELVDRLHSPKLQELVDRLYNNEEFLTIIDALNGYGVDLHAIADLLYSLLGLELPHKAVMARNHHERSVYVDLDDFIKVVSFDKLKFVVQRYLKHDDEFKGIVAYMKTDDFKGVLKTLYNLESLNYFYYYLNRAALDIYPIVDKVHNKLMEIGQLSNALETKESSADPPTRGLDGFIDEILFSLPLGEWYEIYVNKMANDQLFEYFIEHVKSRYFKDVLLNVLDDEEFKGTIRKMADNGFDITFYIDWIHELMESNYGHRTLSKVRSANLHEDFKDFIALLPVDDMVQISVRYYLTDPDVQKAVAYLQSEEFRELALKFQHDEEFHELVRYFKDSGADVVILINMLNNLLGLPDFPDIHIRALKSYLTVTSLHVQQTLNSVDSKSGGMQSMLDEIRGVIPYDDIQAMYDSKMENSVHFQYFVKRMKAAEHQELIDKLVQNENVLTLAYQAHIHGINIEHIGQVLFELFGLEFPENPFGY